MREKLALATLPLSTRKLKPPLFGWVSVKKRDRNEQVCITLYQYILSGEPWLVWVGYWGLARPSPLFLSYIDPSLIDVLESLMCLHSFGRSSSLLGNSLL